MKQLNRRQTYILNLLQSSDQLATRQIVSQVSDKFDKTSRATIIRDLEKMLDQNLIVKQGRGRGVVYQARLSHPWLGQTGQDASIDRIDFSQPKLNRPLFSNEEQALIGRLTKIYQNNTKSLPDHVISKEFERFVIDFSWKSSRIEGNTYTLLETEQLLKTNRPAPGHTREEATMIQNHKKALDYVLQNPAQFLHPSIRVIEDLHRLATQDLGVEPGLRSHPVGIVGTTYLPFDNRYQITEALKSLCDLVDKTVSPLQKALIVVAGISYIQPFADGNKRTGRIAGNALLLAHDLCPLSYRDVNEIDYKQALINFYESHSLIDFKSMFLRQYQFAVGTYFRS